MLNATTYTVLIKSKNDTPTLLTNGVYDILGFTRYCGLRLLLSRGSLHQILDVLSPHYTPDQLVFAKIQLVFAPEIPAKQTITSKSLDLSGPTLNLDRLDQTLKLRITEDLSITDTNDAIQYRSIRDAWKLQLSGTQLTTLLDNPNYARIQALCFQEALPKNPQHLIRTLLLTDPTAIKEITNLTGATGAFAVDPSLFHSPQ